MQARSIYVEEGLYYLCSENKGVDQLCSYCTEAADLCLCFSHVDCYFSGAVAHLLEDFTCLS